MRLLVIGGTVFLGRHVAEEAVRRGHEVTLFHRGRHGDDLLAGRAEHLLGDRTGDLGALAGRSWDAAIDTCGFEPGPVARSSALEIGHLVFVSSISAYPAWPEEQVDEDSPVWSEEVDDYGPLKVACERAAEAARAGRVAIVRAGLLCGPYDNIARLSWWIERIAAGGDVLAPGAPGRELQLIDARDLAAWMARRRRGRRRRRRAVVGAAALAAGAGQSGGGHRARACRRPAVPPGRRDGGGHLGLDAVGRAGVGLPRADAPGRAQARARGAAARGLDSGT